MTTWFTSDLHFGHRLVALDHRGYDSIDNHDSDVLDKLLGHMRRGDRLINLGDNAIEGTWLSGLENMRQLRDEGITLELRIGNHERIFPARRDAHKFYTEYADVFDSIQLFARHKLNGIEFLTSHFPYWPHDRGEGRHQQYRPVDLGLPIVHGHTHSEDQHEFPRHLHVGWDAWRRPVSQDEVMAWLNTL